jgi:hypothetical protein
MTPLALSDAAALATEASRFRQATALAALVMACALFAPPSPVVAQVQLPPVAAASRPEEGIRWQNLTPAQREVLAPLEREWPGIDAPRKQKWLVIAGRYRSLPPPERARIAERMTEWAKLTPAERGEVRLRYQEARQLPAPDRQARWQAYQKLPADEKQQFAARAAAVADPSLRDPELSAKKTALSQAKTNVVPNPALAQPPRQVSPTVVQGGPGATTRLITRPATPPAHQQTGMPKIAATPEFVNRTTLLPRRGPQAAAVAPTPSMLPARPLGAAAKSSSPAPP